MQDAQIRKNLRRSLRRFLAFLGLQIQGGKGTNEPMRVERAANFNRRVPTCWQAMGFMGNHNWLRISRVLHCLGMVRMEEEQQAFSDCLEQLYKDGLPVGSAIHHWRDRAAGRGARRKANDSSTICTMC
mmetsp:Transcript_80352/g.194820  ORF Transcript_80352/g.194820 Transcript_80352/m.194820 type:complete len:129 (-) Transcript_80352:88-474(-)